MERAASTGLSSHSLSITTRCSSPGPWTPIPRTLSGKITELAVREVIHGRPVKKAEGKMVD